VLFFADGEQVSAIGLRCQWHNIYREHGNEDRSYDCLNENIPEGSSKPLPCHGVPVHERGAAPCGKDAATGSKPVPVLVLLEKLYDGGFWIMGTPMLRLQ